MPQLHPTSENSFRPRHVNVCCFWDLRVCVTSRCLSAAVDTCQYRPVFNPVVRIAVFPKRDACKNPESWSDLYCCFYRLPLHKKCWQQVIATFYWVIVISQFAERDLQQTSRKWCFCVTFVWIIWIFQTEVTDHLKKVFVEALGFCSLHIIASRSRFCSFDKYVDEQSQQTFLMPHCALSEVGLCSSLSVRAV